MFKHLLRFWLCLLLTTPVAAIAQEQHSACISTHFHHFYGPSDTVKVISVERLRSWSTWCQYGYTAQKLEDAIRPCYEDTIETLRSQSDGYINIGMKKTQQVKNYCKRKLWSEVIPTENTNQS